MAKPDVSFNQDGDLIVQYGKRFTKIQRHQVISVTPKDGMFGGKCDLHIKYRIPPYEPGVLKLSFDSQNERDDMCRRLL